MINEVVSPSTLPVNLLSPSSSSHLPDCVRVCSVCSFRAVENRLWTSRKCCEQRSDLDPSCPACSRLLTQDVCMWKSIPLLRNFIWWNKQRPLFLFFQIAVETCVFDIPRSALMNVEQIAHVMFAFLESLSAWCMTWWNFYQPLLDFWKDVIGLFIF